MTTPETRTRPIPNTTRTRGLAGAARVAVTQIMSREVVTVLPQLDLDSLATLLIERGLSRIPVADGRGQLVGIVSKTDLVADHQREIRSGTVADIMVESVLSLCASTTSLEAARLLSANNVHGAPVVAPTGALVGYLSAMDVLAWLSGQH